MAIGKFFHFEHRRSILPKVYNIVVANVIINQCLEAQIPSYETKAYSFKILDFRRNNF